jgi:hypothetical protein
LLLFDDSYTSIPKVAGSIPTVAKLTFQLARCGCTLRVTSQTSYLQYCVIVWELTYPNIHRITIELLQKRVNRILNKSAFDAHILLTLYLRSLVAYWIWMIFVCYNWDNLCFIINFLLPERFDNMFLNNNQTHTFNTRNSSEYYHRIYNRPEASLYTFP